MSTVKVVVPPKRANTVHVVLQRGWTDLEPKVAAGLASGAIGAALIGEAATLGYPLDPTTASLITLLLGGLAGYFKSSSARETFEGNPDN